MREEIIKAICTWLGKESVNEYVGFDPRHLESVTMDGSFDVEDLADMILEAFDNMK